MQTATVKIRAITKRFGFITSKNKEAYFIKLLIKCRL
jgi:cold shock CspA family protein